MPESATEYYKKVASHLFSSLGWPCGYRIVFLGSFFGVFFLGGGGFLGNFGQFWAIWGVFLGVALFRYRSIRALAPAMCSFHCAHTPTQPGYCPLGNTPCPFLGWLRRQSDRAKVSVEFAHISHKYIHFVTNVLKCARFGRYHRSFSVDDQGYT